MAQLLKQHIEVFGGEAGQANNWARQIHQPCFSKRVLGQARLQGWVAKQTSASVHQELRGATQDESKPLSRSLQRIIEDAQDLLVVGIACLRVGQLVEVDQLVEADHQAAKTCEPDES